MLRSARTRPARLEDDRLIAEYDRVPSRRLAAKSCQSLPRAMEVTTWKSTAMRIASS